MCAILCPNLIALNFRKMPTDNKQKGNKVMKNTLSMNFQFFAKSKSDFDTSHVNINPVYTYYVSDNFEFQ